MKNVSALIASARTSAKAATVHASNVHEALLDALASLECCDRCKVAVYLDDVALVGDDDGAVVVCPRCAHEPPPIEREGEPVAR